MAKSLLISCFFVFTLALVLWLPDAESAQTTSTIPAGVGPWAVAVNPVTNRAYVANHGYSPGEVTVIDGVTNTAATVAAGLSPTAVAVNPVTNKIYVANYDGNSVTVIDGATNTPTTLIDPKATGPAAIAVNPETNMVYIGNYKSRNVTVVDGSTDTVTATVSLLNTAATGARPLMCMAVNPVTNMVYVTNYNDNSVTVIDGATNAQKNVSVGPYGVYPLAVAVNQVTNKVYVVNTGSDNVTVINGATNATNAAVAATVGVGSSPKAVAINPLNNKIYVVNANTGNGTVSVINGATDSVATTVAAGSNSQGITVNPVSSKVYVANAGSNTIITNDTVTVIDSTNDTVISPPVPAGFNPLAVAVNMITNVAYVANNGPVDPSVLTGSVTVITETPVPSSPLITSITPLPGNTTGSTTPTFSMTATSATGSPVRHIYYQVDTIQGAWLKATPGGPTGSGTTPPLAPGVHTLYAFATDGSDATSINTGAQSSPLTGAIASYSFTVTGLPPVTYTVTPVNTAHGSISPSTQQVVNPNATIDFTVTPDNGYTIVSVTGCGGSMIDPATYRTAAVTANCDVTPTFSTNLLPVRIGSTYYQNLVDAYKVAPSGSVIQAMATSFIGDLNLNQASTLQGGYDVTYAALTGNTVMVGRLTVGTGSLVVDRLTIQ